MPKRPAQVEGSAFAGCVVFRAQVLGHGG
jgi:hypothetical protein